MKNISRIFYFCALLLIVSGCAGTGGGLGSISKTNLLMPGMNPNDVKAILVNISVTVRS